MPLAMATEKRLRVSFDAESEVVRRAIYIAAAAKGKTHNELLNELIKDNLGQYMEFAKKEIEEDSPKPKKRKAGDDS